MFVNGQGSISFWLAAFADAGKLTQPFRRCMPYCDVRLSQIDDDIEDAIDNPPDSLFRNILSDDDVKKIQNDHDEYIKKLYTPIVDIGSRRKSVPQGKKSRVNKRLYAVQKGYKDSIPWSDIVSALEQEGLIPIQEDGCIWQGMFVGGAECGTDEARDQVASLDLAMDIGDGTYVLANAWLHMSWCTMSNRRSNTVYEIVAYVS